MTGAEVKAQVMEALDTAAIGYLPDTQAEVAKAEDALAPCIVLTAEEAARVISEAQMAIAGEDFIAWLRVLLTPEAGKGGGVILRNCTIYGRHD